MYKRRLKCLNKVWQYFHVYDAENRTAICKKCNLVLSFRSTVGNLRKHYESKHGEVSEFKSDNEDMEDKMLDDGNTRESDVEIKVIKSKIGHKKRSKAWKYFKESGLDDHMAICNLCGNHLSYYSSITNLVKHIRRKHPLVPTDNSVNDDDNEAEGPVSGAEDNKESEAETKPRPVRKRKHRKSRSKVWKYFTIIDDSKLIAKCNICSNELSFYSSVGNLMKHAFSQHGLNGNENNTNSSDEDDVFEGMASTDEEDNQKEKSQAMLWLYFKCLDPVLKISKCLICMKRLSSTSVANLKKHLMNKHPQVKLSEELDNAEKQIIVDEDGQVYEIENNDDEEHKPTDSTPIDTVYLEDYMDDEPEQSKYEPKRTKYGQESTIYKPRTQRKQLKRLKTNNVLHKIVTSNEELSHEKYEREREREKEDSLDHFAKYATSLLRQLPKNISDQLQMGFIKEILDAKIKNETVTDVTSNNYSITVTNLVTKGNNDIPNMIMKENNDVENNGVDRFIEN